MSFANEVKEELSGVLPNGRHCHLAEISALEAFGGEHGENTIAGRKLFTLRKKTDILYKCADADLRRACCRRAYVRGAFLGAGYCNHPDKGYDLEFVCETKESADILKSCLSGFSLAPKLTRRKGVLVLYIKEAEAIADTLNIMGARKSLLYFETLRVEKDVRNSVNRQVNCETANIAKTIGASAKHIADIEKIQNTIGIEALPEPLKEAALARLAHRESSLAELGSYLDPPVGKSGVNKRLQKISGIAADL